MNKIQIEAAYQLAQMDYENNPNQVNENRLKQTKAAFEQLSAPAIAAPEKKEPKAPAPKKDATVKKEPKAPAPKKDATVKKAAVVKPEPKAEPEVKTDENQDPKETPEADENQTEEDANATEETLSEEDTGEKKTD